MRHVFIAVLAAVLWLHPAAAIAQQETATLIGTITDAPPPFGWLRSSSSAQPHRPSTTSEESNNAGEALAATLLAIALFIETSLSPRHC